MISAEVLQYNTHTHQILLNFLWYSNSCLGW